MGGVMGDPILLASDHRGVALKKALCERLQAAGREVRDLGAFDDGPVNYPEFAAPAARAVSRGEAARAIVICGTGLGVMYTANRFPRVRAALVHDVETAALARRHNDANVLALSGDGNDPETAWRIVETWLETPFDGGRHAVRVDAIDRLTRGGPTCSARRRGGRPTTWS
jgi:ribose 5-phosphate isomerase B